MAKSTKRAMKLLSMPMKRGEKRDEPKMEVKGEAAPARLDRPAYKHGGKVKPKGTTVNVMIGSPGGAGAVPVPAGPPMPMRGPMVPPGPPVGPPGALGAVPVAPVAPPMKRGGKVMAGAGSGVGRLQRNRGC